MDAILLKPASSAAGWLARGLASMHHGRINAYAAYVLIALLVVLIIALLRGNDGLKLSDSKINLINGIVSISAYRNFET